MQIGMNNSKIISRIHKHIKAFLQKLSPMPQKKAPAMGAFCKFI